MAKAPGPDARPYWRCQRCGEERASAWELRSVNNGGVEGPLVLPGPVGPPGTRRGSGEREPAGEDPRWDGRGYVDLSVAGT